MTGDARMARPEAAERELLPPTYLGGPAITTDNCEREPIHLPGSVQPHGALLTADANTHLILQVSAGAEGHLGQPPAALLGRPLSVLLPGSDLAPLLAALPPGSPDHRQYRAVLAQSGGNVALTCHRAGDLLVLEFEANGPPQQSGPQALRNAVFALESAPTLAELTWVAVQAVRELTGFDRVMIYRFAQDASGEVLAEARSEHLGSFLGHRFPESDIPAQARALYVRHLLRLTADTEAVPDVLEPRLNPQTGTPTPLGGAVLRATSPMHLQYLRNMGVRSSLSVSIVVDGQLWGLISCHHGAAHVVEPETRTALEYLGRLLSLQVQVKERADTDAFRRGLQARRARIVEAAAHSLAPLETFSDKGLDLAGLMRAGGVVAFFEGGWQAQGQTPPAPWIEALLAWLRTREGTLIHTDALAEQWPGAAEYMDTASGLLAISVSGGWSEGLVWLRPEIRAEVAWGGATPEQAKGQLGPRRSFETYVETVRGRSVPWHPGEIEEAGELGQALTSALGARLNVVRDLNRALERSNAEWRQYAFVIAHDMQEPVRLISQFAELFHLRFGGQVDAGGERMLRFMLDETTRLRALTRDLHTYTALLSAPPPVRRPVPLARLVQDALHTLADRVEETAAAVEVSPDLPVLQADAGDLRELLLQLLANALTFSGGRSPRVQLGATRASGAWKITVRDEGPGIAPEFQEKVFGLFQRLGRREDSPGSGIGLALARLAAERHGGTLTVSSTPGRGSVFTLHLPDLREASGEA